MKISYNKEILYNDIVQNLKLVNTYSYKTLRVLDRYKVDRIYNVVIAEGPYNEYGYRRYYMVEPEESLVKNYKELIKGVEELKRKNWVPVSQPKDINELVELIKNELYVMLIDKLTVDDKLLVDRLLDHAAFTYIGLASLKPLIDDPNVDEIFQDSSSQTVYLDHRHYGRCITNVMLDDEALESLVVFGELFKNVVASHTSPSIKFETELKKKQLRISIDLPPLTTRGFALHIRKHREDPLMLSKMIVDDVISVDVASLLLTALYLRSNVLIIGASSSGKTTLLNALDASLPPTLRRVYIEDVEETLDLADYGFHQAKIRVGGLYGRESTKTLQVLRVLHKSPDILILGEIQYKEHVNALFNSLCSGVKGLQTFHALSSEQAVRRLVDVYGVREAQLIDLDLIVSMFRPSYNSPRRIVVKVDCMTSDGKPLTIYSRGLANGKLAYVGGLEDCHFYKWVLERYGLKVFDLVNKAFYASLVHVVNSGAFSRDDFLRVYHPILHLRLRSVEKESIVPEP